MHTDNVNNKTYYTLPPYILYYIIILYTFIAVIVIALNSNFSTLPIDAFMYFMAGPRDA